jgi:hypothetical protein
MDMSKQKFKELLIETIQEYYDYLHEKDYFSNECEKDFKNIDDFFKWLRDGFV